MRFDTDVDLKTKHNVELENFLGVDFSSSPINVSKKRASFAKNLVSIDGVNQKRPGWKELIKLDASTSIINTYKVTNLVVNKLIIGGEEVEIILAVTADGLVYRVYYDEYNDKYEYEVINKYNPNYYTTAYYSITGDNEIFIKGDSIYIVGGEYLVYKYLDTNSNYVSGKTYNSGDYVQYKGFGYQCIANSTTIAPTGYKTSNECWLYSYNAFKLERVSGYIPTTTIGIKNREAGDTSVTSNEEINLLTASRYNKLLGTSTGYVDVYYDTADQTAVSGKTYYQLVEGSYVEATVTVGQSLGDTVSQSNGYYEKHSCVSYLLDNGSILYNSSMTITITTLESGATETTDTVLTSGYPGAIFGGSPYQRFIVDSSYGLHGFIDYANGIIYLNSDVTLTPPVANQDNIKVQYVAYDDDGDTIRNCHIGHQFGINGNSDILFLSGNPDYQNQDFYSDVNGLNPDWTYFPAGNIETFGTKFSAVKAYIRIADGTLAVLKEQSNTEPTIYYRTASTTTETLGEEPITKIVFPVSAGAIGEGAVNNLANCNLAGDNLFLSNNGVFGIVLADNVVANERYARERDRFVHSSLIKHDLTNAVATVFNGRYILAVDDVCYVFDSRYKSTETKDADDTYNYESWYWDNIPATALFVSNNKLYFGTDDGRICVFETDSYEDVENYDLGTITVDTEDDTVTVSSEYADDIEDGQAFYFLPYISGTGKLYYNNIVSDDTLLFSKTSNPTVTAISTYWVKFYWAINPNLSLYKNQIIVAEIDTKRIPLRITETYTVNSSFYFIAEMMSVDTGITSSTTFVSSYTSASVCNFYETLNYKKLLVSDFNGTDTFNLIDATTKESISIREIVKASSTNLTGYINLATPVKSLWFSPALDLGLSDYSKNLDSISVVLDPNLSGTVNFGYETKKVSLDLIAKQIEEARTSTSTQSFSFDDIDFNNFTFETAFTSSYTKRVRERNVNFIMFKAYSNDNKNSALQSLKAVYTIYKKNRGVR